MHRDSTELSGYIHEFTIEPLATGRPSRSTWLLQYVRSRAGGGRWDCMILVTGLPTAQQQSLRARPPTRIRMLYTVCHHERCCARCCCLLCRVRVVSSGLLAMQVTTHSRCRTNEEFDAKGRIVLLVRHTPHLPPGKSECRPQKGSSMTGRNGAQAISSAVPTLLARAISQFFP
jgi:hypothetical protein